MIDKSLEGIMNTPKLPEGIERKEVFTYNGFTYATLKEANEARGKAVTEQKLMALLLPDNFTREPGAHSNEGRACRRVIGLLMESTPEVIVILKDYRDAL